MPGEKETPGSPFFDYMRRAMPLRESKPLRDDDGNGFNLATLSRRTTGGYGGALRILYSLVWGYS
jgi:hypothetical protein